MYRSRRLVRAQFWFLAAAVLAVACAQNPPSMGEGHETEYIQMLRTEFFKSNPNGQYNENISRSEVVVGMDFLEVLSSWGNPVKRQKPAENIEHWIYMELDRDTGDRYEYTLIFRDNTVADWALTRYLANGSVDTVREDKTSVLSKKDLIKTDPESAPKKK